MHISKRFGIKISYRKCRNPAAGFITSIRNIFDSRVRKTINLKMTENYKSISTNENNFQTECAPTDCVVDEHCLGSSNSIPSNPSRDTEHADRIQESIINLDNTIMSSIHQNSAEYPNNGTNYLYPLVPQIPYYFTYPMQNHMYRYINYPVPFNYTEPISNTRGTLQNIPGNGPFYAFYHQNGQNAVSIPIPSQYQSMPYYTMQPHNPMFQAYPNFILNQPTTAYNVLPIDSHRRDFHRQRDVSNHRTRSQDRKTDIMSLRLWENIEDGKRRTPGYIFTLMSYNVLAQDLADMHPQLYGDHNQRALKWGSRWPNLFNEIKKLRPDILCLQEVQESHLASYYSVLETLGYRGIFKKRTGNQSDGCAIYYQDDIFNLVEYTTVEFLQRNVGVLDRDNVGIVAKFAPKLFPTHEFVVATTHLLYNPKRDDVRMAQMQLLLTEVERISYKKPKSEDAYYVPVIITGDFNSPPYSDLYKFLSQGKLDYESLSPKLLDNFTLVTEKLGITDNCQHAELLEQRKYKDEIPRSEELDLIDINHSEHNNKRESYNVGKKSSILRSGILSHNFALKSVYDHGNKYAEATTHQDEWLTVDYIFYSGVNKTNKDKMVLLSRYRLPTSEELGAVTIPNQSLGSDHLSLMAKFKLEFM